MTRGLDHQELQGHLTLLHPTGSDAAGARQRKISVQGKTAAGLLHTLLEIVAQHEGAAADQKCETIVYVNDGNDGTSPTEVLRIASTGVVTFAQPIGGMQPVDADLTAIAALTTTAFGRALLTMADATALRAVAGAVIGTDVQAYHANLAALAGLAGVADRLPYFTGAGALSLATLTAAGRSILSGATVDDILATLGGGAPSGTGVLLRATSPALVTPALGTPASGNLLNCVGQPYFAFQSGNGAMTTTASHLIGGNTAGIGIIPVGATLLLHLEIAAQVTAASGSPVVTFTLRKNGNSGAGNVVFQIVTPVLINGEDYRWLSDTAVDSAVFNGTTDYFTLTAQVTSGTSCTLNPLSSMIRGRTT